jgi:hypothetical protein
MNIDPNLAAAMAHLAELAIPSATATIYTKVEAITKGKATEQTVNELKQIINDLIKERNDLVAIAQTYEQELVAQRISDKDIKYIIDSVLPVLKIFVEKMPASGTAAAQKAQAEEAIDILEQLLSVDMLTVLQLLGFNYKRAIGEPLTLLLQKLITSISRPDPQLAAENNRLNLETSLALANIAQDEEATERLRRVLGIWRAVDG